MNSQFKKGVLELIVLLSVNKKDMYGYELVLDSEIPYMDITRTYRSVFNDYAKVEYTLNGVKYTAKVTIANPNSYSEKAIMEMPKEIANASDIDLIITIRNISYRINLL